MPLHQASVADRHLSAGERTAGSAGRRPFARLAAWIGLHRRWAIAVAAFAVLAALLAAWELGASAAVGYVARPVTRGSVSRSVTATGSVNPVLTIIVGSYVSGVIQDIYCDFNTRVKKGQLCARIDPRPYQTAVDQERAILATARAQVAKDEANAAYTRVTKQRYANLFASKAVSQDALDVAINNEAQARAQVAFDRASVEQHAAALAAAEVNLGYTNIVSPVDGTVVSRNVTMGQTVAASFQTPTLFLIATDLSRMQVDTNVSESDIGGIRIGNRASFSVDAYPDRLFEGAVSQVRQAPQTVQNVVTYDVVVTVPNPQFLLKPGMTATVRIVTEARKSVLRIPNQALRYTPGGLGSGTQQSSSPQVWVLRNGKPEPLPVKTGLDDDTYTEITGGPLTAGDRVIVSEARPDASAPARAPAPRF